MIYTFKLKRITFDILRGFVIQSLDTDSWSLLDVIAFWTAYIVIREGCSRKVCKASFMRLTTPVGGGLDVTNVFRDILSDIWMIYRWVPNFFVEHMLNGIL